MKDNASILTMYAVTPCHAGSGSSVGVVDLPIQRERHTNWPVIASSGVKGSMRAHFDKFKGSIENKDQIAHFDSLTKVVFGTDNDKNSEDKSGYAGSLSVSDAKILAYPMRSNIAPFVWITSPAVLKRLAKDLKLAGKGDAGNLADLNNLGENSAWCLAGDITDSVLLEDMEVKATAFELNKLLLAFFKGAERLLIVHDKIFDYGVSNCTSITAQIKIDQATGTTQNGSLRYQEELPPDTLMYCVIFWGDSHDKAASEKWNTVKKYITCDVMKDFIQIGGDETCGRGIFELNWNEGK
ncbi:MAG TPA: type III-B CRISPR module RAMP protein Cmr4 [Chitinispirillaceae bacterium]|nr:type III-B CRISPR module RAMP protein Cmr4 [Chitinispirillaceae bacterium]